MPCAFQERVEPFGRLELLNELLPFGCAVLLFIVPGRPPGCVAYGGRFAESCDIRFWLIPCGAFCIGRVELFIAVTLLCTAAPKEEGFMVRTGMCEAAAAGDVRAITLRFCTAVEGVFTRPCWAEAAPK